MHRHASDCTLHRSQTTDTHQNNKHTKRTHKFIILFRFFNFVPFPTINQLYQEKDTTTPHIVAISSGEGCVTKAHHQAGPAPFWWGNVECPPGVPPACAPSHPICCCWFVCDACTMSGCRALGDIKELDMADEETDELDSPLPPL